MHNVYYHAAPDSVNYLHKSHQMAMCGTKHQPALVEHTTMRHMQMLHVRNCSHSILAATDLHLGWCKR